MTENGGLTDRAQLIGTGDAWMAKGGMYAFDRAIKEFFKNARSEILITAYMFTGGASEVLDLISQALDRNVKVWLVVNDLENTNHNPGLNQRLTGLLNQGLKLYSFIPEKREEQFTYLHAKMFVADRKTVITGSFNLTGKAMNNNHEMGVMLTGSTAEKAALAFQGLLSSPCIRAIQSLTSE